MTFEVGNRLPSAHSDSIWAVRWCHNAIITAGLDAQVKCWLPASLLDSAADATLAPISVFEGHSLAVVSIGVNPSGTMAASSAMDGSIIVYDIKESKQVKKIDIGPTKNWSVSLVDQLLATGGHEGLVHLYNYHSGDNVSSAIKVSNPFVLSVQFNASGDRLAVGGSKGEAGLFDPATGRLVENLESHSKGIRCIEFAASDNNVLLTGSEDNSIGIFDVRTGHHIASVSDHNNWVMGLTSHRTPSGVERFASCSSDKTVKLWDLRSHHPLHTFDKCHVDQITSVAFSPSGDELVSVSDDASIQLYHVPR